MVTVCTTSAVLSYYNKHNKGQHQKSVTELVQSWADRDRSHQDIFFRTQGQHQKSVTQAIWGPRFGFFHALQYVERIKQCSVQIEQGRAFLLSIQLLQPYFNAQNCFSKKIFLQPPFWKRRFVGKCGSSSSVFGSGAWNKCDINRNWNNWTFIHMDVFARLI